MLSVHRSARTAALALAVATPSVLGVAPAAFASGESTSAVLTSPTSGTASTFTWTYSFHQNAGHGLSNVAVGFCSPDILADVVSAGPSAEVVTSGDVPGGHTGFGPGIKFAVTAASGTLTVTFGHAHTISAGGLRVQSHSGDGQDGDAVTVASGPGPCASDETTTTTSSTTTTTSSTATTTSSSTTTSTSSTTTTSPTTTSTTTAPGGSTTTTTTGSNDTTTTPSTTATTAGPTNQVGGATGEKPGTLVFGETMDEGSGVRPDSLARTGAGRVMFLVTLGCAFLAAGFGLMSAFRRRRTASASFPG